MESRARSKPAMSRWLQFRETVTDIYSHGGRFRPALAEDVLLAISLPLSLGRLFEKSATDGFFDSTLTLTTLGIAAMVMVIYHVLWRTLEGLKANNALLEKQRPLEQYPRLLASFALLVGFANFATNIPIFLSALVIFYLGLNLWHITVTTELRTVRGTFMFDLFGLVCSIAFAVLAAMLYMKSKEFWQDLPRYISEPLSADVVRRSFAGTQTNYVYAMGCCAGAMAANAILAFIRGLTRHWK